MEKDASRAEIIASGEAWLERVLRREMVGR